MRVLKNFNSQRPPPKHTTNKTTREIVVLFLSRQKMTGTASSDGTMIKVYEKYVADPDITTVNCSFGPDSSYGTIPVTPGEVEAHQNFMQNGRGGKACREPPNHPKTTDAYPGFDLPLELTSFSPPDSGHSDSGA